MPLGGSKSCLLTSASGGLNVVGENGFSISAIQHIKDLGVVMTSNYVWAEPCKVVVQKQWRALQAAVWGIFWETGGICPSVQGEIQATFRVLYAGMGAIL